jgi:DNA helicase II / ATP-dependent DNA helicase PcrA
MLNLDELNPNQRQAVEWSRGPLLVLAGPGSGKTKVLTMRAAKLIRDSPSQRFRVLGLTFTNRAASEMRNRLNEVLASDHQRVCLATFHSFCVDILRQHGSHVGLRPDFTILSDEEDRNAALLDTIHRLEREGYGVSEDDVKLLPVVTNLLDNLVDDDRTSLHVANPAIAEKMQVLYRDYKRQLLESNRVDFPLLLQVTHRLLTSKAAIAKQVRAVYTHICVDEFQDTNLAQYELLKAIVGEQRTNLFVVADDDQIMYQWNGASPERLAAIQRDFEMDVIQLPANYRCPPSVIGLANKLITNNLNRTPGKRPLEAVKTDEQDGAVRVVAFADLDEELAWIADDIRRRPASDWGTCTILARARKMLEAAVPVLESAGLEGFLSTRKGEFESTPFRWLHSMLRLANARMDKEQCRRVCKAFYQLEGIELSTQDVVANGAVHGGDLLRSWFALALARRSLDAHTRPFFEKGQRQLAEQNRFIEFIHGAHAWFESLVDLSAAQGENINLDSFGQEKAAWKDLHTGIQSRFDADDLTLSIYLQEFDLAPKSSPMRDGAVRCFTIHTAKGMEFNHVYLIGLVEDELPSYHSIKKGNDSREIQEERRNCFVAITRTQESLVLTWSRTYSGWEKRPSRFLREMGLV